MRGYFEDFSFPPRLSQEKEDALWREVEWHMNRDRKRDSALETCLYLRKSGIPFEEVLSIAKRLHATLPV